MSAIKTPENADNLALEKCTCRAMLKCFHNVEWSKSNAIQRFVNTVNIAFSECSHLVNDFKRDRSTPSKEKRAKEPSIQ